MSGQEFFLSVVHSTARDMGFDAADTGAYIDRMTAKGWDFSHLSMGDEAGKTFVRDFVRGELATVISAKVRLAQAEANRKAQAMAEQALKTDAARVNPAMECTRCNGKGKIRGFEHVSRGTCFACQGAGVRRSR